MTDALAATAVASAQACQDQLVQWLRCHAYPIWADRGVDTTNGGFHEAISQDGMPLIQPRRARVQPRQIFAFASAVDLGWHGDVRRIVERAMGFFLTHYRRHDGLYRTLVAPDGSVLDNSVWLYDQAFALLGIASARRLPGADPALEEYGNSLFEALGTHLRRVGQGFFSGLPTRFPLLSNPHMHLFESALEWREISRDRRWPTLCDELGELVVTRLIDPDNGAVHETFDEAWSPVPGVEGRRVEPGHQFEWAWLLLRWHPEIGSAARRAALRLIDIAEQHGVQAGLAVDALLDDFSVRDGNSRLWPQAERLKATALAAALTGEPRYWQAAAAAARGLLRYFQTPTAGLWFDRFNSAGVPRDTPAPASSFYHIVAAIGVLTDALRQFGEPARLTYQRSLPA
jgi:mannose/cellobiose epimerase-like protein (N-acyl-D-glucosamine 2-epimerase family)